MYKIFKTEYPKILSWSVKFSSRTEKFSCPSDPESNAGGSVSFW
jgi:hypothetical protein